MRESGITEEEADDDEVIRLLAEWNGNIKDAVLNGEKGRAWKKATLPIPRAEVLATLKTGKFVSIVPSVQSTHPHTQSCTRSPSILPISPTHSPTYPNSKKVWAGYDKVGRAICYYRVKLHDPKKFQPLDSVKAVVYLYEEVMAQGKLKGAQEICVVIDRTDAKASNMDIEVRKDVGGWMDWEDGDLTSLSNHSFLLLPPTHLPTYTHHTVHEAPVHHAQGRIPGPGRALPRPGRQLRLPQDLGKPGTSSASFPTHPPTHPAWPYTTIAYQTPSYNVFNHLPTYPPTHAGLRLY